MHACSIASVTSSPLQPYGLQPARLLYSWDSPRKNTAVGCHAFLQGIFPDPMIKPASPALPVLQVGSLPLAPPEKPSWLYNEVKGSRSVVSDALRPHGL